MEKQADFDMYNFKISWVTFNCIRNLDLNEFHVKYNKQFYFDHTSKHW